MPGTARGPSSATAGVESPYLMVGRTGEGRDITVVLLATAEKGAWLAYTAWDTKQSDQ